MCDESDEWEERKDNLRAFFDEIEEPDLKGNLSDACYSYSEMLTDYGVDPEEAIFIWKIVESMRQKKLPDEFVM